MNGSGRMIGAGDADCDDDESAAAAAEASLAEGGQADVWAGTRFVCRVVVLSPAEIEAAKRDAEVAARRRAQRALDLLANGVRPIEVAKQLGIAEASVYRMAAEEWANAAD